MIIGKEEQFQLRLTFYMFARSTKFNKILAFQGTAEIDDVEKS
jgi:hypothetical protein